MTSLLPLIVDSQVFGENEDLKLLVYIKGNVSGNILRQQTLGLQALIVA